MGFHVLNFLSTMETSNLLFDILRVKLSFYNGNLIFYGVSCVKLSFYNGKNLLWSFAC